MQTEANGIEKILYNLSSAGRYRVEYGCPTIEAVIQANRDIVTTKVGKAVLDLVFEHGDLPAVQSLVSAALVANPKAVEENDLADFLKKTERSNYYRTSFYTACAQQAGKIIQANSKIATAKVGKAVLGLVSEYGSLSEVQSLVSTLVTANPKAVEENDLADFLKKTAQKSNVLSSFYETRAQQAGKIIQANSKIATAKVGKAVLGFVFEHDDLPAVQSLVSTMLVANPKAVEENDLADFLKKTERSSCHRTSFYTACAQQAEKIIQANEDLVTPRTEDALVQLVSSYGRLSEVASLSATFYSQMKKKNQNQNKKQNIVVAEAKPVVRASLPNRPWGRKGAFPVRRRIGATVR